MSTSTDAQLFYGVYFDEDTEFAWGDDIEGWWVYEINGFKHSFELFDSAGNYLNGREPTQEENRKYWGEYTEFLNANPLPVELVNYCSGDCPMYAIAVKGTVMTAKRGIPAIVNPKLLRVTMEQETALVSFLDKHDLTGFVDEPAWLLTSYWG